MDVEANALKEALSCLKAGNHSNVVLEMDAKFDVHNILLEQPDISIMSVLYYRVQMFVNSMPILFF